MIIQTGFTELVFPVSHRKNHSIFLSIYRVCTKITRVWTKVDRVCTKMVAFLCVFEPCLHERVTVFGQKPTVAARKNNREWTKGFRVWTKKTPCLGENDLILVSKPYPKMRQNFGRMYVSNSFNPYLLLLTKSFAIFEKPCLDKSGGLSA